MTTGETTTEATCDQCSKPGKCISLGDAYICEECVAFHERAIDAAVDAVDKDYALFGNLHGKAIEMGRDMLREIVGVAVKTYCEYPYPDDGGDGPVTDDTA